MNKKISICLPCYNSSKYLDKLFVCINNQTFKDFEVVAIDDGSIDDTYNKLCQLKNKYHNLSIRCYKQENQGISVVRNKLIELSIGQYLFFVDSDDLIYKNALEVLYNNAICGNYDIVSGRVVVKFKNNFLKFPFFVQYRFTKNITSTHYVKSNLCTI